MKPGEITSPTLRALLEQVKRLPPMTEEMRFEQTISFAYGNLACTTNHKPSRAAFKKITMEHGWSEETFNRWAEDKTWR